MLSINMFSSADKVKGQGVGSAYLELIEMLQKQYPNTFEIHLNKWRKADITHYHTVDFSFYLSTFFKKRRGRKIGYVHFLPETLAGSLDLPWPINKWFNRYLISFYQRMDHLVVVNPSFIPKLNQLGIASEKVTYIPNFVSTAKFYEMSVSEKQAKRAEYGYTPEDFVILGAGQIQERKGIDDFVQLAKDNPQVKFVWAGGFSFGRITSGYHKYKEMYEQPPENLVFTGIVSRAELVAYYNAADLFLLPSYNELFPMCILEAFNCGTPVMLRDLDLYHAIIKGNYLAATDRAEMEQEIKKLAADPQLLDKWKRQSAVAAKHYSEERVAELWSQFYFEQVASEGYPVQSD